MKVLRVTVSAYDAECGVVFETAPDRTGRALLALSDEVRAAVLDAAQKAVDTAAGEVQADVQGGALTTELHRLRNARQELDALRVEQAKAIDEHAARVAEASRLVEEKQAELAALKTEPRERVPRVVTDKPTIDRRRAVKVPEP